MILKYFVVDANNLFLASAVVHSHHGPKPDLQYYQYEFVLSPQFLYSAVQTDPHHFGQLLYNQSYYFQPIFSKTGFDHFIDSIVKNNQNLIGQINSELSTTKIVTKMLDLTSVTRDNRAILGQFIKNTQTDTWSMVIDGVR